MSVSGPKTPPSFVVVVAVGVLYCLVDRNRTGMLMMSQEWLSGPTSNISVVSCSSPVYNKCKTDFCSSGIGPTCFLLLLFCNTIVWLKV